MNWVAASLLSALFLGFYELCTKHAVRANSVVPVLFFSTLTAAVIWLALLALEALCPGRFPAALVPDTLTWTQHGQLILKSMLVASSWIFMYLAVKHLPLSLGSPIRATSPLWTLASALHDPASLVSLVMSLRRGSTLVAFAGGLLFFGEHNGWQKLPAVLGILVGILLTMLG